MASYNRPVWLYSFELAPGKWIFVPDDATKNYGRELKQRIAATWRPPSNYVHLGSKGHVRALRASLQNRWFARIDIKGFYNSITKSRITRHLRGIFRDYEAARAAAVMSTVPNPDRTLHDSPKFVLPFGFVQSPILAALCLHRSKLGRTLNQLPKPVRRCIYVDDILLSTEESRSTLDEAYEQVCSAAIESGFTLNEEKATPPSEQIQIFNINVASHEMCVSDARLEEFQRVLSDATDLSVVAGILGYVRSVNPSQALMLEKDLSLPQISALQGGSQS